MTDMPKHVLDGYRVLDFTQFLAGPTVTRYMAELGAEIIKVEIAPIGDYSRAFPFIHDGRSAYYVQQNRGKKSLCLNIKNPAGAALIRELVPKVDVLVENFAPGVIARMGFDYKTVSALNPKIIMCSISSLGQTGPLSNRPGYDYIGSAYSGVLDGLAYPDQLPIIPQVGIGDITTGVHAMGAISTALLYRERTGKGQFIETSLLDCYFSYHEVNVQTLSASHGAMRLPRNGSQHQLVCPVGIFRGKSNPIVIIAGIDHQWPYLCRAMGKPELAADPRLKDIPGRVAHAEEIRRIVQDWLDSMPSDEEAMRLLEEHRVPFAPVLTTEEAMNHPHLRERGTVRTVSDRFLGEFELPGFPLRFSEFPGHLELEAPTLGEHNEAVLHDYLGYTPDRIRKLEAGGVLHRGPR
ncbi:MAG: CaiB/BaiF CoA transferase family protein [Candidatus Binataceae bacterium]